MPDHAAASKGVSHKVVRNTAYNIAGRMWATVTAILLTPYVLHRIGSDRYGILALSSVLIGYMGLLDLGMGSSFGRFIAEYDAARDDRKICEVVGTGAVFYAFFGALVLFAGGILLEPFIGILKIPSSLHGEAVIVFWISLASFAVGSVLSAFSAVPLGLQRMDITNKVAVAVSVITVILTVLAIRSGYALIGVAVVTATSVIMTGCVSGVIAVRLVPALATHGIRFSRKTFRQLFDFGYKMQMARVSGIMTTQIDKLLIGVLLSVNLVTAYQIGSGVILYAVSFAGIFVAALMPAFTEIMVRNGREALVKAYLRTARYLTIIVAPLFVFIMVSAPLMITAWLGHPFLQAAAITQVVALAWMVNTIAQTAAMACIAVNRPGLMARGSIIIVILNLAGSFLGIKLFGVVGAAWGNACAVSIGTAYFLWELNKALGVGSRAFARATLPFVFFAFAAALPLVAVDAAFSRVYMTGFRHVAITALCARAAFFMALYAAGLYRARLVTGSDAAYFRERMKHLHGAP